MITIIETMQEGIARIRTPKEIRVGTAIAETIGLSAIFTVEEVREAVALANGKPKDDGWIYKVLDSMELKGLIEANIDTVPVEYTATPALGQLLEAHQTE